jgi:hypothetical protein
VRPEVAQNAALRSDGVVAQSRVYFVEGLVSCAGRLSSTSGAARPFTTQLSTLTPPTRTLAHQDLRNRPVCRFLKGAAQDSSSRGMGLSEYLAGDLALLDDPDLAEDEADLVRDLEHFRRQQQAERAVRRAARQGEETSGASTSRRQLPGGGGGGGSRPSSSARPAPVELDLSRHELSCVDETRLFDDPLDRQ